MSKQIYEMAYELVANKEEIYSCNAILRASIAFGEGTAQSQQKSYAYGTLFKPDCFVEGWGKHLCSWLNAYAYRDDNDGDLLPEDTYNWRLTALAFCIAMAETGDL